MTPEQEFLERIRKGDETYGGLVRAIAEFRPEMGRGRGELGTYLIKVGTALKEREDFKHGGGWLDPIPFSPPGGPHTEFDLEQITRINARKMSPEETK